MSVLKNVGVIGAGQMGCGIAHVAALAGYTVTLYDLSSERLAKGRVPIREGSCQGACERWLCSSTRGAPQTASVTPARSSNTSPGSRPSLSAGLPALSEETQIPLGVPSSEGASACAIIADSRVLKASASAPQRRPVNAKTRPRPAKAAGRRHRAATSGAAMRHARRPRRWPHRQRPPAPRATPPRLPPQRPLARA